MARTLGVHSTPKAMFLAVVEDGQVLDEEPQKIDIPAGLRSGSSLKELVAELRRRLPEARVAQGAILEPQSYDSVKPAVAKLGAETLLRLTAVEVGFEVELLHRATARSRMGLGSSGELKSELGRVLPTPIGRYWTDGRNLAAFAALACEKGT